MAIKERKQITGTTAQIQAYAGHEGQIVWDKDKKTFVGMSGTAGKNYPLAQQAYVDTQFLPLTGGTLTGALNLTRDAYIRAIVEDAYKGLELSGGPTAEKGANLVLRNVSATASGEAGLWGLLARDPSSTDAVSYLIGTVNDLRFNGRSVERIEETASTIFNPGFCSAIRYTSGLQIVYASLNIPNGSIGSMLTFTRPFASDEYAVSATGRTPFGNVLVSFDPHYNTGVGLYRTNSAGTFDFDMLCTCIVIGRWK